MHYAKQVSQLRCYLTLSSEKFRTQLEHRTQNANNEVAKRKYQIYKRNRASHKKNSFSQIPIPINAATAKTTITKFQTQSRSISNLSITTSIIFVLPLFLRKEHENSRNSWERLIQPLWCLYHMYFLWLRNQQHSGNVFSTAVYYGIYYYYVNMYLLLCFLTFDTPFCTGAQTSILTTLFPQKSVIINTALALCEVRSSVLLDLSLFADVVRQAYDCSTC